MKRLFLITLLTMILAGCSGSGSNLEERTHPATGQDQGGTETDGNDGSGGGGASTTTFKICSGPDSQSVLLRALFQAQEGDRIELCAGEFSFDREIPVHDKRGITLAGAGSEQTIISFANSSDAWGLSAGRMRGFTLQGMTVRDAPSVGVMIIDSAQVILRDVRVLWSGFDTCDPSPGGSCSDHGDIAASIEFGSDVLIEDSEFLGAALFGLAFTIPRNVTVRRSRLAYNTGGMLIDNFRRATITDNQFDNNAIGILASDSPNLVPAGGKSLFTDNKITTNNTQNFAPIGSGVRFLPYGIGMIVLAADQVEIAENEFMDNGTTGLVTINHGLLEPEQNATKFDFFPEGVNIHDNLFRDNGGSPAIPDPNAGPAAAFVPLILSKNGGKSAQIAWDGGLDSPNSCDSVPVDERGVPLNQPNPDSPRDDSRTDERGRPNFNPRDPEPECRWNAWKFDDQGELKKENRLFIDNNKFESTRPQTAAVDDFVNFNITTSEPGQIAGELLVPASNDLAPHAGTLSSWPVADPDIPYVVDPRSADHRQDPTQTALVCATGNPSQVNWQALLRHDCPLLSDYALFADPDDPRINPNPGGMLYQLNSALFSDYAVKYRFVFIPPGNRIRYKDYEGDPAVDYDNDPQRSLELPVGTVIAKTFAFRTDDKDGNRIDENVVETRLLIKRQQYDRALWTGMAYRWRGTHDGPVAELLPEGAKTAVSFDYLDKDPDVTDAVGNRQRYTGQTDHYSIPVASGCAACHGGTTREPGTSPISLKPRHINLDTFCEATGSTLNQLDCLVASGMMDPLPDVPANLERSPRWNVPGDGGKPADSVQDIHQRMRAYLEINCAYCHSQDGRARFTGLFLDSFRAVDKGYGICRRPLLSGRFGNRQFDIEPGDAKASVLHHRDVIEGYLRMPPQARSLHNLEASSLMTDWINRALIDPAVEMEDAEACDAGGPPFP